MIWHHDYPLFSAEVFVYFLFTMPVALLLAWISTRVRDLVGYALIVLTLVMVAQSDTIAPVALDVAKFINADDGLAGAIEILPIAFDIDVQPYSLIRARNRALSPAASLLYDHILQEIR